MKNLLMLRNKFAVIIQEFINLARNKDYGQNHGHAVEETGMLKVAL